MTFVPGKTASMYHVKTRYKMASRNLIQIHWDANQSLTQGNYSLMSAENKSVIPIYSLTRENCFNVPRQNEVQNGIEEHHTDTLLHVECVVRYWGFSNVTPLHAFSLFLITSQVRTSKPKGNVG